MDDVADLNVSNKSVLALCAETVSRWDVPDMLEQVSL